MCKNKSPNSSGLQLSYNLKGKCHASSVVFIQTVHIVNDSKLNLKKSQKAELFQFISINSGVFKVKIKSLITMVFDGLLGHSPWSQNITYLMVDKTHIDSYKNKAFGTPA